jgi:flagellar motor switch protein FliG
MAERQAGELSKPSTEFGAIPNFLKMPPEQLKEELKKTHPNTLAVKLIHYSDSDVAKIASALSPKRRKEMLMTLKMLKGETLNSNEKQSISRQLIAVLLIRPFHHNYKKILTVLIISLTLLYVTLGNLP